MIEISEKDLYLFIFHPGHLSEEKRSFINKNRNRYAEQLNFLKQLKSETERELDPAILRLIYAKIDAAQKNKIIVLEKIVFKQDTDYLVVAAESSNNNKLKETETFKDANNRYLCKVITDNKKSRLFIFTKDQNPTDQYSIRLQPSNETYQIISNDLPLVITPPVAIKKVEIEISN